MMSSLLLQSPGNHPDSLKERCAKTESQKPLRQRRQCVMGARSESHLEPTVAQRRGDTKMVVQLKTKQR